MFITGQKIVCDQPIDLNKTVIPENTPLTVRTITLESDGELMIILDEHPTYKMPLVSSFKSISNTDYEYIKNQPNKRH